jgi:hypothetical protein
MNQIAGQPCRAAACNNGIMDLLAFNKLPWLSHLAASGLAELLSREMERNDNRLRAIFRFRSITFPTCNISTCSFNLDALNRLRNLISRFLNYSFHYRLEWMSNAAVIHRNSKYIASEAGLYCGRLAVPVPTREPVFPPNETSKTALAPAAAENLAQQK